MKARRFAFGLFGLSAALLGYELLLMRLLTLAQWGHFAGFVISIAMLGLAASGLCLHFQRDRAVACSETFFSVSAGLTDEPSMEQPDKIKPVETTHPYSRDVAIELKPHTVAVVEIVRD